MADLVPIPLALFDRLRRIGLNVDAILRRANLPRSRFNVPRPHGSTAEFFALWHAVEMESDDPGVGLRIGVEALPDEENVVSLAAMHSRTLGLPRLLFALLGTLLIFGGTLTPAQNSGKGFELHANGNARAADVGLPLYPRSKLFKSVDSDAAVDMDLRLSR